MADLGSLLGAAGIGGAIGQAIVRLELDTAKYSAEMKAAQGQTIASTNAMGASTSKFSGLAQSALLGVGVAAVAGAAMSVKAAVEANEAHLKLQNTFENNAALSDSSVEAFEAQADALRDLTGVDDEAIISGQALLGQFDLTGKQVMELTPLVVDLSAKLGIDLDAAFKAAGKAATGNTGALARYVGTIEVGQTEAETFTNIIDKLGRAQGFAAERAEAEPWRVLGAQFEEIAEQIGQAILPALQNLAELLTNLLPILAAAATAIQYLPLVQMSEGFEQGGSAVDKFTNALIDSIPVLGSFVDVSGGIEGKLADQIVLWTTNTGLVEGISKAFREQLSPAVDDTKKQMVQFAGKTSEEIKEWADDTKESFRGFVLSLDKTTEATIVTRREFVEGTRDMLERAENLDTALRRLSREKWVNDEYIEFLANLGPENLIAFERLNDEKQRKMQEAWEETTRHLKGSDQSLMDIIGTLDKLDKGTSKHTVIIDYRYEGFDPSKPGMSGAGASGPAPRI